MGSWAMGRVRGSPRGAGQGPGNHGGSMSGKVVNAFCSKARTDQ